MNPDLRAAPDSPAITKGTVISAAASTAAEAVVGQRVTEMAGRTCRFVGSIGKSLCSWTKRQAGRAADTSRGLANTVVAACSSAATSTAATVKNLANAAWEQMPEVVHEGAARAGEAVASSYQTVVTHVTDVCEASGLTRAARFGGRVSMAVAGATATAVKATGSVAFGVTKATAGLALRATKAAGSALASGSGRVARLVTPRKVAVLFEKTQQINALADELVPMLNDPDAARMELSPPAFDPSPDVSVRELEREQDQLWDAVSRQSTQFAALLAGARAAAGEALSSQDVWDCYKAAADGYVNWSGWRQHQQQLQANPGRAARPAVVAEWMTLSAEERLAKIPERCKALMDQMLKEKYHASWLGRQAAAAAFGATSNYMSRLMARFADKLLPALRQMHSPAGTAHVVGIIQNLVTALAHKMEGYHDVASRLAAGEQFIDEATGAILRGNVQEVMTQVLSASRFNNGISAAERERLVREYLVDQWVPDLISASSWFKERMTPHFHGPWWQQLGQALLYILTCPFLAIGWVVSRVVELIVNPILKRQIHQKLQNSSAIPEVLRQVREAMVPTAEAAREGDSASRMSLTMKRVVTTALRKGSWKIYRFVRQRVQDHNPASMTPEDLEARRDKPSNIAPAVREHARSLMRSLLDSLKIQNAANADELRDALASSDQPESLGRAAQLVRELCGESADHNLTEQLIRYGDSMVEVLVECLLEDPTYILTAVNESLRAVSDVFDPSIGEPSAADAAQVEVNFNEALSEVQKQLGCLASDWLLTNPAISGRRELLALDQFFARGAEDFEREDPENVIANIRGLFEEPAALIDGWTAHADRMLQDHAAMKLDALTSSAVGSLQEEFPNEPARAEALHEHLQHLKRGVQMISALGHLSQSASAAEQSLEQLGTAAQTCATEINRFQQMLRLDAPAGQYPGAEAHWRCTSSGERVAERAENLLRDLQSVVGQRNYVSICGLDTPALEGPMRALEASVEALRQANAALQPMDPLALQQRRQLESTISLLHTYFLTQGVVPADRVAQQRRSLQNSLLGSILRSLPIPQAQLRSLEGLREWKVLAHGPTLEGEEADPLESLAALRRTELWPQIDRLPGVAEALEDVAERLHAVEVPDHAEASRALLNAVQALQLPSGSQWSRFRLGLGGSVQPDPTPRLLLLQGELHARLLNQQPISHQLVGEFGALLRALPLQQQHRNAIAEAHAARARLTQHLQEVQRNMQTLEATLAGLGPQGGHALSQRLTDMAAITIESLRDEQRMLRAAVQELPRPTATRLERESLTIQGWQLPTRIFFKHLARRLAPADVVNPEEQRNHLRRRLKGVVAASISRLADQKIRPLLGVTHNGALFSAIIDTGMAALASYQAGRSHQTPAVAPFAAAAVHPLPAAAPAGEPD
jgi:hypothetical protein